ncbi:uncharacterized protein KY384_005443 [Bacidia gigantensis]|uniref:uncharacterized protein n=1 Tax=Bacidia gigantensis TaxID=2732470 RepID=UPI001D04274F|nr:uncharacterized protein KY384_005443 [Bacidia gigantensis]KAG8529962.1 hypothetical protein KY384_005443 [Bacidia gigantensis]
MPRILPPRHLYFTPKTPFTVSKARFQSSLQANDRPYDEQERQAALIQNTLSRKASQINPQVKTDDVICSPPRRKPQPTQSPHRSTGADQQHVHQTHNDVAQPASAHGRLLNSNQMRRQRKTSPVPVVPLVRRARRGDHQEARNVLKDEAYIRSTMHVPTSGDYPDVSIELFKLPKQHLHNMTRGLADINTNLISLSGDSFRCTLTYDSPVRKEVVEGEGRSKRSAEDAAYLHFLAKCHSLGVLMEVVNRESEFNQRNRITRQQAKQQEKDAIVDIFDYAARFNLIPEIHTRPVTRKQSGRPRASIEAIITLKEQNISVSGFGTQPPYAEADAAIRFKKEAERFQAKEGKDALIIKDSSALTTENAGKFIEFLRIVRPGIRIEVESEAHGRSIRAWVIVNGDRISREVLMSSKKKAEAVALLLACITLKTEDQDLWPRYLRALQHGNGQILPPVAPLDMFVDEDCSLVMRETLLGARSRGLPDEVLTLAPMSENSAITEFGRISSRDRIQRSQILYQWSLAYANDERFVDFRSKKAEMPMNQYKEEVLRQVNENEYSIIVGATGSGKTTQVPQILLENMIAEGNGGYCNIICTQPRRIAATSVARRVAAERGEGLEETVGYKVRFDAKLSRRSGSINYCTTGILLRQLQHAADKTMDDVSHLVIDEVHERSTEIDFLLILLKKNMTRRKLLGKSNPRVILMSATMDTDLFANYFETRNVAGDPVSCPSLSVPGRTFPVRERYIDEILEEMSTSKTSLHTLRADPKTEIYLDAEQRFSQKHGRAPGNQDNGEDRSVIDWKRERKYSASGEEQYSNSKEDVIVPFGLIAATVAHIAKTTDQGAILVFLPGLEEIRQVKKDLGREDLGVDFTNTSLFQVYMLHSSITTSQQTVFDPVPQGCRKIVLSTNIAETSVTISDVQHVVDSGKLREKQYDQGRRITMLACTWISKSNSRQRAGRAGRVQDGNYYALFSKARYESFSAIGLPELLRSDLQKTCLDIKAYAFQTPIRDFLADAIEPPAPRNVDASVFNLQALDALTEREDITPLGRLLSSLPVDPSLGKMIVLGIIFRCLDPMLVLGAASTERPIFINPLEARIEAHRSKISFVQGSASDHIALLNAVRQLRQWRAHHGEVGMRQMAERHFLHANAFRSIDSTAQQIEEILVEAGMIPNTSASRRVDLQFGDPALNENSHKVPLIKALVLAGLHPNLAVCARGGRLFRTPGEKDVLVHPSSTNDLKDDDRSKARLPHSQRPGVAAGTLYSYTSLTKSNDGNTLFLRDTTRSTPLQACLFGGKLQRNEDRSNIVEIDSWLPFYIASPDRRTAKTLIEFRKGLERLLATTFNELGVLVEHRQNGDHTRFLADDVVREMFAAGLVEVLDRDVTPGEKIRRRGWAATRQVDHFPPEIERQGGRRTATRPRL